MHDILNSFAVWLRSTSISESIRVLPWLWPVCEIAHFVGLSLLVGVVGFFDLRLLGLFARVPLNAAWSLMPWGKAGFGLATITGITFFIGAPDQYVTNVAFYGKLVFLAIAGLNAVSFERIFGSAVAASDARGATSLMFKVIGAVSIACWFLVIYWGRMLPFVGNAF
jgi:hypothetical protein